MKKYMILALLTVLFQGALHASQAKQVMQPGLQNIKELLKNPMISNDLDSVLNGLLDAVKNGAVGKDAAIAKVEGLKKTLEKFKAQQYPNYFMSFFVSTPDIVKNEIQPALDKVNKSLAELKNNAMSVGAIVGITIGTVAGVAALAGLSALAANQRSAKVFKAMDDKVKNWNSKENVAAFWAAYIRDQYSYDLPYTEAGPIAYEAAYNQALIELEGDKLKKCDPSDKTFYDAKFARKAKDKVWEAANKVVLTFLTKRSRTQSITQSASSENIFGNDFIQSVKEFVRVAIQMADQIPVNYVYNDPYEEKPVLVSVLKSHVSRLFEEFGSVAQGIQDTDFIALLQELLIETCKLYAVTGFNFNSSFATVKALATKYNNRALDLSMHFEAYRSMKGYELASSDN